MSRGRTHYEADEYTVRSAGSRLNAWEGALSECYAWLAGWTYNRGLGQ